MIRDGGANVHLLTELYSLNKKSFEEKTNEELRQIYAKTKPRVILDNVMIWGVCMGGMLTMIAGAALNQFTEFETVAKYIMEGGGYATLVGGVYISHHLCTMGVEKHWTCSNIKDILAKKKRRS